MTPEERWQAAHEECRFSVKDDQWACRNGSVWGPCFEHGISAVRAALRERDAAWAKAFLSSHLHGELTKTEGLWRQCKDCAPLRALLEEAGK